MGARSRKWNPLRPHSRGYGLSALTRTLLAEFPTPQAIATAFAIGFFYALVLLGPRGAFGVSPFWDLPTGLIGGPLDIRQSLAGYWWFTQDTWRWPLLTLPHANWPEGTNAVLFDCVPIVAIIGKLLRTVFNWSINPYPLWVTGCFAMNAAALASLVRALGQRSVLGAILAGAFGAMAPVVQYRFGHMALMAHWLPVLALALYFQSKPRHFDARAVAGFTGLTLLATFTSLYLFVMTAAISAAAVLQAVLDRRSSLRRGFAVMALLLLAGIAPLWAFGLLGAGGLIDTGAAYGFGVYSMNLASPFWPQTSGLFQWTGNYWLTRGSIGATSGQYEGFDYLGGGALLLLGIAAWRHAGQFPLAVRRHAGLAIALLILTVWALSNRVYLGPYLIVSYGVPDFLANTVLSWFRSSGRFFWPVGWLLVGIGIARGLPLTRPASVVAVGAIALLLQWSDVEPWREKIAQLRNTPPVSAFGTAEAAAQVAQAIKTVGAVAVVPPIFCSSAGADFNSPLNAAALEVEIMAARGNARMSPVYLARGSVDCTKAPDLGSSSVLVLLKDEKSAPSSERIPEGSRCHDFPIALVCIPVNTGADKIF